jgi:serine O-acetyltransferase
MLKIYRLARWLLLKGVPVVPRLLYIFNRLVFSVVLPPSAEVGRDVVFGYSGLAIVVHKRAKIGDRVIVGPNVTIGGRSDHQRVPVIGNDVIIGAGARIIGPVKVGNGARIGANAVVLKDVPAGGVAVGVPAKTIRLVRELNVNVNDGE